jgi:hypothetical protein
MKELDAEFPGVTLDEDLIDSDLIYSNFYKEAMNELDTEFPGATYDESLNNSIYKKERLKEILDKILCISLVMPTPFFMFYALKVIPFSRFTFGDAIIGIILSVGFAISLFFAFP